MRTLTGGLQLPFPDIGKCTVKFKNSLLELNCNIVKTIFWVKIMGKSVLRTWYILINVYFNDIKFKKWHLILKVLGIFFCVRYICSSFYHHFPNSLHQMPLLLDHRTTASFFYDYHWQEKLLNKNNKKIIWRIFDWINPPTVLALWM